MKKPRATMLPKSTPLIVALFITTLLHTHAAGTAAHPAVIRSEFINKNASYSECHASTIAETSGGRLVASWFGG